MSDLIEAARNGDIALLRSKFSSLKINNQNLAKLLEQQDSVMYLSLKFLAGINHLTCVEWIYTIVMGC